MIERSGVNQETAALIGLAQGGAHYTCYALDTVLDTKCARNARVFRSWLFSGATLIGTDEMSRPAIYSYPVMMLDNFMFELYVRLGRPLAYLTSLAHLKPTSIKELYGRKWPRLAVRNTMLSAS